MKRTLKIFAAIAILTLALCSVFALATSAEESAGPDIVSANISFEGDYAILLAIDASTVKGGSVSVTVWDNTGKKLGEYSDSSTEKISTIDAEKDYYVIKTPGIASKNMDKVYTYQATDAEGNAGAVAKLSVAEYFYARLFFNGIVNATEGADYVRRDFYIDALEHGAKAQNLLYNYNDIAGDEIDIFVTDLLYVNIPGANFGGYSTALLNNNTTKVTLPGKGNYTVTQYDPDTLEKSSEILPAGTEITLDKHTVVTEYKEFIFGQGQFYNDSKLSGATRFDYTSSGTGASGDLKGGDTVGPVDGKLVFQRNDTTGENSSYMRWNFTTFTGGENEPIFVYETDFMFDGYVVPNATAGSRVGRFDFRTNNSVIENSFREFIIYANEVGEGGIINSITIGLFELEAGEWYNIGFVLDYKTNEVEYFLNGVSIGTEAIGDKLTTSTNRSIWYFEAGQTAGSMNFDNTVIATYDANPPVGGEYFQNTNINGIRMDSDNLLSSLNSPEATKGNDTVEIVDGKLVYTNAGSGGGYIRWDYSGKGDATAPVLVFEADITVADVAMGSAAYGTFAYIYLSIDGVEYTVPVEFWSNHAYYGGSSKGADTFMEQKYNIRLVVDATTKTVKCYVNGDLKKESVASNTGSRSNNWVRFAFSSSTTAGQFEIDNVFIGVIDEGATN